MSRHLEAIVRTRVLQYRMSQRRSIIIIMSDW